MKKIKEEEAKVPAWLITFSDLMTLLLTFFVLLLSMSVIDNKKKLEALGSIRAAFGVIQGNQAPDDNEVNTTLEHGVFTKDDVNDLLSERVSEPRFTDKDIEFIIDRHMAIIRVADDVLFGRGAFILTPQGKHAVDRILPLVLESIDPVTILGSSSTVYDEFKVIEKTNLSMLWRLSLRRALAIYLYIKQRGAPVNKILLEGVGDFHKTVTDKESAQGLARSRRTDFVFGKKDIHKVERLRAEFTEKRSNPKTVIQGFEFSLE